MKLRQGKISGVKICTLEWLDFCEGRGLRSVDYCLTLVLTVEWSWPRSAAVDVRMSRGNISSQVCGRCPASGPRCSDE